MTTSPIHRIWSLGLLMAVGLVSIVESNTYTVNSTADSGEGSFLWAVTQANFHAGPDTIRFAIPESDPGFDGTVWRIRSVSGLPVLSDNGTVILGSTQTEAFGDKNPDGPEIVLDGTDMPGNSSCLSVNSSGNVISGLVISGSRSAGITIIGDGVRKNRIVGNYIGTDPAGLEARPNQEGIRIEWGAAANRVGGSDPSERNVISGCARNGIALFKSDSNVVTGNFIGLDRTGTRALGNGSAGVDIADADHNRVGGSLEGERNIISGNGQSGINMWIGKTTRNNTVLGNFIGTDAAGTGAIGNVNGVVISNEASANRIGGEIPGESNLISGNTGYGVYIMGAGADSNRVEANLIGTGITGNEALPNATGGVCIYNGPKYNRVGPYNVIRYNMDGVFLQFESTLGNTVVRNSISNNVRSGIMLFNGANGGINRPVLVWDGSGAAGTAEPDGTVEIFSDSSGQGRIYEGSVTADGEGRFSWSGSPAGPNVTATATDADGNTSEFSLPASVTAVPEEYSAGPRDFSLSQNFPNPFNPHTLIRFGVKQSCRVTLKVFDAKGREAAEIADDFYPAGEHEIGFDASSLASGIYLLKIRMGPYAASRKMVIQK